MIEHLTGAEVEAALCAAAALWTSSGGEYPHEVLSPVNGLVADARALSAQLGIGYQAAEDADRTDPWVSPVPGPWGRPSGIAGL